MSDFVRLFIGWFLFFPVTLYQLLTPSAHCVGRGSVDCPANHVRVYFVTGQYSLE